MEFISKLDIKDNNFINPPEGPQWKTMFNRTVKAFRAKHLKSRGAFTHFLSEINSVSRGYQRILSLPYFSFSVQIVPLIPHKATEHRWAETLDKIKAIK